MSRFLGDDAPLPTLEPLSKDFYTRGAVMIQRCNDCSAFQHPPEEICGKCQSSDLGSYQCAGKGQIESRTIVHKAVHPGLMDSLPYVVAVISLDDAQTVNVIGNIANCEPEAVEIGMKVEAFFEEVPASENNERMLLPQWKIL